MRIARVSVLLAALLMAFLVVGCGDDDDDGGDGVSRTPTVVAAQSTPTAGGQSVINVTLKEFEVLPDKDSVPAGKVTFRAKNTGPEDAHELVVVKSDLAPGALPTSADGAADEEGAGVDLIGEIAEFAVGGEEEITFDLEPGKYVLLCNVVEEAEGVTESHYKNGMHTAFTVE